MREPSLSSAELEIPDFIKGVSLDDIDKLCANEAALSGLWEKSQGATAIYEQQVAQATHNKQIAEHLTSDLTKLEELRKEVNDLMENERQAYANWQRAESQTYEVTRPYTRTGIKQNIERHIEQLLAESANTEDQLIDGDASDIDPIAQAKKYVQIRRQYYYNKTILESLS